MVHQRLSFLPLFEELQPPAWRDRQLRAEASAGRGRCVLRLPRCGCPAASEGTLAARWREGQCQEWEQLHEEPLLSGDMGDRVGRQRRWEKAWAERGGNAGRSGTACLRPPAVTVIPSSPPGSTGSLRLDVPAVVQRIVQHKLLDLKNVSTAGVLYTGAPPPCSVALRTFLCLCPACLPAVHVQIYSSHAPLARQRPPTDSAVLWCGAAREARRGGAPCQPAARLPPSPCPGPAADADVSGRGAGARPSPWGPQHLHSTPSAAVLARPGGAPPGRGRPAAARCLLAALLWSCVGCAAGHAGQGGGSSIICVQCSRMVPGRLFRARRETVAGHRTARS